jgi:hypothetical protein
LKKSLLGSIIGKCLFSVEAIPRYLGSKFVTKVCVILEELSIPLVEFGGTANLELCAFLSFIALVIP